MSEIISFGEWVQKRRNQLELTRKGLAELVVCSPVTIKKIERDERRPSPQIAELLAQHLQLPESEHDNFMRRARGEFVSDFLSPTELSIEETQASVSEEDAPKHNLPPQPTPFFGRHQELADIASNLANPNCHLLTILGAGGMGKTRLSIEAARRQVENFTDGITYVELAPLSPAASAEELNPLVAALADSLDIGFYGRGQPEQQLFDYLQRKEKLLVFDNFEHLVETAVFLSNLLSHAPDVKIVVTSREQLNLQEEWLFPLQGLSIQRDLSASAKNYDDAVQLFSQRAKQVHPSFNADAELGGMQQICQLVEGMPLGLELAAAWVNQLSCKEIAAEIAGELDFLSTEVRNVPDRHRSIRTVFDYSREKLSPKERDVLKKLSVFRGGFERKGAKAVAGALLSTLSKLVSKSLLVVGENGRYQIHELLRQFAAERLAHTHKILAEAQQQHSHYYLTFVANQSVNIPGNTDYTQFTNIEREIDNIRVAIQHSLSHSPELFLDMAVWEIIVLFFDARGLFQEGEQLTEAIANAIHPLCLSQQHPEGSPVPSACRYWALYRMGKGAYQRRLLQFDQAKETIQQALQHLPENNPDVRVEQAYGQYCLAFVAFGKGDLLTAESHFIQGIEQLQGSEWRDYAIVRLYAMCLVIYGQLMYTLGDYQKSETLINEGYKIVEEFDDRGWLAALTLHYKAGLAEARGEYAHSEQLSKSALEIVTPLQYPSLQNMILRMLAIAVSQQGRLSEAHEYVHAHNKLAMDANLPFETHWGQKWLGIIAVYAESYETAMQIFQTVAPPHKPSQENFLGWTYLGLGKVDEAKIIFQKNLEYMLTSRNKRAGTEAVAGMAYVKAQSGYLNQALMLLALVNGHQSSTFRIKKKAKKLWDELAAELPEAVIDKAEAQGKALDSFETAEAHLSERNKLKPQ